MKLFLNLVFHKINAMEDFDIQTRNKFRVEEDCSKSKLFLMPHSDHKKNSPENHISAKENNSRMIYVDDIEPVYYTLPVAQMPETVHIKNLGLLQRFFSFFSRKKKPRNTDQITYSDRDKNFNEETDQVDLNKSLWERRMEKKAFGREDPALGRASSEQKQKEFVPLRLTIYPEYGTQTFYYHSRTTKEVKPYNTFVNETFTDLSVGSNHLNPSTNGEDNAGCNKKSSQQH